MIQICPGCGGDSHEGGYCHECQADGTVTWYEILAYIAATIGCGIWIIWEMLK